MLSLSQKNMTYIMKIILGNSNEIGISLITAKSRFSALLELTLMNLTF